MTNGLDVLRSGLLTENLILLQGLGVYALTRYTASIAQAWKVGSTMLGAMITGALGLWIVELLAIPEYLGFISCLAVAAFAAWLWQRLIGLEVSLSDGLLDTALLGLLLMLTRDHITGYMGMVYAAGAGLGYLAVLLVIAYLRNQLELAPVPKAFKGVPLVLITAGLLGMVLLGFKL
ncbi:MAG: hypothetical protein GX205_02460 [Firmicutes bacterium]|nr:hypothetical protein [Bacillota bacterium]